MQMSEQLWKSLSLISKEVPRLRKGKELAQGHPELVHGVVRCEHMCLISKSLCFPM